MMTDPKVTWGEDGFADSSGWAIAYCSDAVTGEYLGPRDVWVSAGTGMPSGAWRDAPPTPEAGRAVVRNMDGWELIPDYRGVTAYDKTTGHPMEITEIGPIADTYTLLTPSSPFDRWTGQAWEKDEAAEQSAKLTSAQTEQSNRIEDANQQIAILHPAVDGGYAKPGHDQLLSDWQRYRYELALVPENPGWPESPQWPDKPGSVV